METQPHLYAPLFHAENTARIWYAQWNNVRFGERLTVYGTTYGLAYER